MELEAIGPNAYIVSDLTTGDPEDSDNDEDIIPNSTNLCIPKMCEIQTHLDDVSDCSYSSDDEDDDGSRIATPLPDDTNSRM